MIMSLKQWKMEFKVTVYVQRENFWIFIFLDKVNVPVSSYKQKKNFRERESICREIGT